MALLLWELKLKKQPKFCDTVLRFPSTKNNEPLWSGSLLIELKNRCIRDMCESGIWSKSGFQQNYLYVKNQKSVQDFYSVQISEFKCIPYSKLIPDFTRIQRFKPTSWLRTGYLFRSDVLRRVWTLTKLLILNRIFYCEPILYIYQILK